MYKKEEEICFTNREEERRLFSHSLFSHVYSSWSMHCTDKAISENCWPDWPNKWINRTKSGSIRNGFTVFGYVTFNKQVQIYLEYGIDFDHHQTTNSSCEIVQYNYSYKKSNQFTEAGINSIP